MKKLLDKKNKIIHVLPFVALLLYASLGLQREYCPKILADEYGYWAAGAFFAGYDWGDISSLNHYYAFGYGIYLALLLKLPFDAAIIYRFAILSNAVFVYISYLFAYSICRDVFSRGRFTTCSISFIAAIFPMSLFYIKFTMCEVFLSLFFWILAWSIWKVIKTNKLGYYLLSILLSSFIVAIHFRMIATPAICCFFIIVKTCRLSISKKRKVGYIFGEILLTVILFAMVLQLKNLFQNDYYNRFLVVTDGVTDDGSNDVVMKQLGTLSKFGTFDGWLGTIKNLIGRVFSMVVSTAFFALFAGKQCVSSIYKIIKRKRINDADVFNMIIMANTICVVIISSIVWGYGYDNRLDGLTYYRYHGCIMGPVLMMGIYYGVELRNALSVKQIFADAFFVLLLLLIIYKVTDFGYRTTNLFVNDAWLYSFVQIDKYSSYYLYALSAFLLYVLFLALSNLKHATLLFGICLSIITFSISYIAYNDGCVSWSEEKTKKLNEVKEKIQQTQEKEIIYIKDDFYIWIDSVQFLLKDKQIKVIDDITQADNGLLLTSSYFDVESFPLENYTNIYDGTFIIWERQKQQ